MDDGTATRRENNMDNDKDNECWKWSSCNVKSLKGKIAHFKQVFQHDEIIALQETHTKAWQESGIRLRLGFDAGIFSSYGSGARGTALLWRKPWSQVGTGKKDKEGRIAGAVLQKGCTKIVAVSVYAPNLDKSTSQRQHYVSWLIGLRYIVETLQQEGSTNDVVLLGDFNQIMNPDLDSFSAKPTVHEIPKEELIQTTTSLDTVDAFRWFNPLQKDYTFKPGGRNVRRIFNRIDYIFASPRILRGATACEHAATGMTDHRIVRLTKGVEEKRPKGLWRHNDSLSYDTEFLTRVKEAMEETSDELDPQARWELSKFRIRSISSQKVGYLLC